jgi:hypothetical protein
MQPLGPNGRMGALQAGPAETLDVAHLMFS